MSKPAWNITTILADEDLKASDQRIIIRFFNTHPDIVADFGHATERFIRSYIRHRLEQIDFDLDSALRDSSPTLKITVTGDPEVSGSQQPATVA